MKIIKCVFRSSVITCWDSKVRKDVVSKTHSCKRIGQKVFLIRKVMYTNHLVLCTTKRSTQWCEKGILQIGRWKVKPPYHLHQDDILVMEPKIPMKCHQNECFDVSNFHCLLNCLASSNPFKSSRFVYQFHDRCHNECKVFHESLVNYIIPLKFWMFKGFFNTSMLDC